MVKRGERRRCGDGGKAELGLTEGVGLGQWTSKFEFKDGCSVDRFKFNEKMRKLDEREQD